MAFDKQKFKAEMKRRGITQKYLAKEFRKDTRTISRWLDPNYVIKSDIVRDLCLKIGVAPEEFDPNWEGSVINSNVARVSARISSAAKNGYWLMKKRYGVTETEICEIAPTLFAVFAAAIYEKDPRLDDNRRELVSALETIAKDYGLVVDDYVAHMIGNAELENHLDRLADQLAQGNIFGNQLDHFDSEVAYYSGDSNPFFRELVNFSKGSKITKISRALEGECPSGVGTAYHIPETNRLTGKDPELNEAIAYGEIELFSDEFSQLATKEEQIKWMKDKSEAFRKRQAQRDAEILKKFPNMHEFISEKRDIDKLRARWEIT